MRDRLPFGTARVAILAGLRACSARWPQATGRRTIPEQREADLSGIDGATCFAARFSSHDGDTAARLCGGACVSHPRRRWRFGVGPRDGVA